MERFLKYPKLIKIHLLYLWNKKNIIVLVIINLLCLAYGLYSSNLMVDKSLIDSNRREYLASFLGSYFFLLKIIYVCFIVFVNISYYGKEYQSYSNYLIYDRKSRSDFQISKQLSSFIFFFFELLYLAAIFYIILGLSIYGKLYSKYISSFLNLYFIGVLYSLLSSFFLRMTGTYLSAIFIIVFYWISLIESDFSSEISLFSRIMISVFPCPIGEEMNLAYDILVLFIYIAIVAIMNFLLTYIKDE